MKANRAYRMIVRRGSRAPAWLADPERVDHIEVVEVDSGEVVLYWDVAAAQTARIARAIKSDLASLDDEAFIAAWRAVKLK